MRGMPLVEDAVQYAIFTMLQLVVVTVERTIVKAEAGGNHPLELYGPGIPGTKGTVLRGTEEGEVRCGWMMTLLIGSGKLDETDTLSTLLGEQIETFLVQVEATG